MELILDFSKYWKISIKGKSDLFSFKNKIVYSYLSNEVQMILFIFWWRFNWT